MVPQRYADLGFEITKFGKNSSALRYNQKPVFVFDAQSHIDGKFLARICDIYLNIEKRKNLASIKAK